MTGYRSHGWPGSVGPAASHAALAAGVLPSAQSVVASSQSLPVSTVPPCDPCDARHPLFGRLGGLFHH